MSSKSKRDASPWSLSALNSSVSEDFSSSERQTTRPAGWKRLCFPKKAKNKLEIFKKRYSLNDCPRACLHDFAIEGMIRFTAPRLFRVKYLGDGTVYTMEVMARNNYRQKFRMRLPIRAKKIQWALLTPFTAQLHFAFKTEKHLFLVMEHACFGDLRQIMDCNRKTGFPEQEVKFFTAQLILALEFLHAAKVLYRSINPKHVSMYEDGYIKLSYFEKAKKLKGGATRTNIRSEMNYRAPEIVIGEPYSYPVDYWALGIFIYETLCRTTPFQNTDSSSVCDNIVENDPVFPPQISEDAKNLMQKLLVKEPSDRETKDLRTHPWFRDLNFEMVWKKGYTFDTSPYEVVEPVEQTSSTFYFAGPTENERDKKRAGAFNFREF